MHGYCSNCRTKYSILNPEEGCSNCAFSFCRKCLPHRAILPQYANKPVTVCRSCYEKLNAKTVENQEKNGTQITRISIGDDNRPHQSSASSSSSKNWWGDGLPPPSLRQTVGQPRHSSVMDIKMRTNRDESDHYDRATKHLQERLERTRNQDLPDNILSLPEIEQRLANLRGCDVELIRRPRCMFEQAEKARPDGRTATELMKEAADLAQIEQMFDPDKEIEEQFKRIKEEGSSEAPGNADQLMVDPQDPRMSTVSSATAFSEATAKELEDINSIKIRFLISDLSARQKSMELEKVNNEIGKFWTKQLEKVDLTDSDEDDEIDDETVKKIILEAEQSIPNDPSESSSEAVPTPAKTTETASPKKGGLFSKIFRR
ncbi:hypothetical protein Q1695_003649 [Nippostrongylus brasiliensis]|nr:hypothetical protein Q1695_003649 [Nippostrongylus brasiliensis]